MSSLGTDPVCAIRSGAADSNALLGNSWDGFPDEPAKAQQKLREPAAERSKQLTFAGLAPGRYAIAVCHDANDNSRCDKNILGIPTEGAGVSNDALRRCGPPRFEDASFAVEAGAVVQTIHYGIDGMRHP